MELFHIGLQLVQQLLLVGLRRADVTVTGHVLCLPQVVPLHPMGDHRRPQLIQVLDRVVDPAHVLQDDLGDAVKM